MDQQNEITLSELLKQHPWGPRLQQLAPTSPKRKTAEGVWHEFNDDKWGKLLSAQRQGTIRGLSDAEELELPAATHFAYRDGGKFYRSNYEFIKDRQLDHVRSVLGPLVAEGAAGLVELGAGYGSKILHLARHRPYRDLWLGAGELAATGRELMTYLAKCEGHQLEVFDCDFRRDSPAAASIPEHSVIYTFSALHYLPEVPESLLKWLEQLRPKAVVFFEPCFDILDPHDEYEALCRRYIELNDYTRDLAGAVQKFSGDVEIHRQMFGINPFLPFSALICRGRLGSR